jgi:hypothetical protein
MAINPIQSFFQSIGVGQVDQHELQGTRTETALEGDAKLQSPILGAADRGTRSSIVETLAHRTSDEDTARAHQRLNDAKSVFGE